MGMSHDFEAAIEEGATMVRVGTAIFGKRSPDAGAGLWQAGDYIMLERPVQPLPSSTSAAHSGSVAGRARDAHRAARSAAAALQDRVRGFDKTDVVAFLTEAADDYEHALREIDRLRQDLLRMEALLPEHRERENNLRNTLLTAQRLADEVKAVGAERSEDDRARSAGTRRPAAAEGAGRLEESSATSTSCGCAGAASKAPSKARLQALYSRARVHPRPGQVRREGIPLAVRIRATSAHRDATSGAAPRRASLRAA
jgi:cell division septum initiation protein DivIVA